MLFTLTRLAIIVLVVVAGFCFWPRQSSLREFDPQAVATLQIAVWKAAAEKDRQAMLRPLYDLYSGQYRIPPITSAIMAFDMAGALHTFVKAPDAADQENALPSLKNVYVSLRNATKAEFDPLVAARMELGAWMLQNDRARRGQLTAAISERLALIYGISTDSCLPAAKKFAQARKDAEDQNWDASAESLRDGWRELKAAVAAGKS